MKFVSLIFAVMLIVVSCADFAMEPISTDPSMSKSSQRVQSISEIIYEVTIVEDVVEYGRHVAHVENIYGTRGNLVEEIYYNMSGDSTRSVFYRLTNQGTKKIDGEHRYRYLSNGVMIGYEIWDDSTLLMSFDFEGVFDYEKSEYFINMSRIGRPANPFERHELYNAINEVLVESDSLKTLFEFGKINILYNYVDHSREYFSKEAITETIVEGSAFKPEQKIVESYCGRLVLNEIYTYDESGVLRAKDVEDSREVSDFRYEYLEYNENGQWTLKHIYRAGTIFREVRREFKYF